MRLTGTGYLGIGTGSATTYPLHVGTQSNNISIYAAFDIGSFSDKRYKTDLQRITNALDKVDQVNGYTFARIDNPSGKRMAGVIAQEVQKVLPEVVNEDDNGMLNVSYGNIVALLIEAVKDLRSEITLLKAKVDNLK
jgi:hypothetical protein